VNTWERAEMGTMSESKEERKKIKGKGKREN
jgi:hypothetical protein